MAKPVLSVVERELRRRQIEIAKAKENLADFAEYVDENYHAERHHRLVAEKLMECYRYLETGGKEGINRLMVFMPPGEGKSELISRKCPAWVMGKLPWVNWIHASYGADLAYSDSAQVRDVILSPKYQDIFGKRSPVVAEDMPPVVVDKRYASKSEWRIEGTKGRYVASGIGGAFTGKHAHWMDLDDPLKNRDEADSEANLDRVDRWYRSAFRTRLLNPGVIVIVLTRWSRMDIAGRLLAESINSIYGDHWEVVMLPAIALNEDEYPRTEEDFNENLSRGIYIPMGGDQLGREPGEPLNPKRMSVQDYERTKFDVDDEWMPLYQQMPESAKGEFFAVDGFGIKERREVPIDDLDWWAYIDLALGRTQTSDFNCSGPMAIADSGEEYIRDVLHVRDLYEFLKQLKAQMLLPEEAGTHWRFEDVAFQSVVMNEFLRDPDLYHIDIDGYKVEKDKVSRARPLRGRSNQGLVWLVRGSWNQPFCKEAQNFPNGRYDDFVDMASGGHELISLNAGRSKNGGIYV